MTTIDQVVDITHELQAQKLEVFSTLQKYWPMVPTLEQHAMRDFGYAAGWVDALTELRVRLGELAKEQANG